MNIIYYAALACLLCSCETRVTKNSRIDITALVNTTLKDVAYVQDDNICGAKLFAEANDSVALADTVWWNLYTDFVSCGQDVITPRALINAISLYNLTDTTSFEYTAKDNMLFEKADTPNEELFLGNFKNVWAGGMHKGGGINEVVSNTTYINDEMITIFQKDYTMIDKFSEYYNMK